MRYSTRIITRRRAMGQILACATMPWVIVKANAQRTLDRARLAAFTAAPDTTAASYLYSQDFESGVNSAPDSKWTSSGTANWNYATSPAPLVGSYSAECATGTSTLIFNYGSDITEVYGFFWINTTLGSNQYILQVKDTATNVFGYITIDFFSGNNHIGVNCGGGGGNGDASAAWTLGTSTTIWFHLKTGTGANAVMEIWWSANETKPVDAPHIFSATAGTNVANIRTFTFTCQTGTLILDKFRLSATAIGSNPT